METYTGGNLHADQTTKNSLAFILIARSPYYLVLIDRHKLLFFQDFPDGGYEQKRYSSGYRLQ